MPDRLTDNAYGPGRFRLLTPADARAADAADATCVAADHSWIREVAGVLREMNASLVFTTSARTKSDVMADAAESAMHLRDAALSAAGHLATGISFGLVEPDRSDIPATIGAQRSRLDTACAALPELLAALDAETDPARRVVVCLRLARAGWVIFETAEILAQPTGTSPQSKETTPNCPTDTARPSPGPATNPRTSSTTHRRTPIEEISVWL